MAIDARTEVLQQVLQDLHERIQGLEEIAVIQGDGKLLARLYQTEITERTFLRMTELAKLTDEVSLALQRGTCTETMIKGENRFLAIYRVGNTDTILGIIGQSTINFGLLNSGCRVAIDKIQEVMTASAPE